MKKIKLISPLLFFISFNVSASIIQLEETEIGLAVINENIEDYRKAWNKLGSLPTDKASQILTATDYRGNNLFHLMAQVRQSHEAFAGEMLQLSFVLMSDFNVYDIFEARNKKGLSPKEVADKAGNTRASEYLTTASNRVKKMQNSSSTVVKGMVPSDMPGKYGVAGIVLALNGGLFVSTGLTFKDPLILTVGVVEAFFGIKMCREAFEIKTNRHSGNMQK